MLSDTKTEQLLFDREKSVNFTIKNHGEYQNNNLYGCFHAKFWFLSLKKQEKNHIFEIINWVNHRLIELKSEWPLDNTTVNITMMFPNPKSGILILD